VVGLATLMGFMAAMAVKSAGIAIGGEGSHEGAACAYGANSSAAH